MIHFFFFPATHFNFSPPHDHSIWRNYYPWNQESEDSGDEDRSNKGNSGWADAMSKILKMGKNSEQPVTVLSKAKRDNVTKKKTPKEKSSKDSEVKEDNSSSDSDGDEPATIHIPISVRRAKKREKDSTGRVKPDITKRAKEKAFSKIATRGVVQLFNAVREQQKDVRQKLKEAGSSRKREKVLENLDKDGFLAVLDGKKPSSGPSAAKKPKTELKEEEEEEDEEDVTWSALKHDFMLGAKMKDWDKEPEEV